MKCAACLRYKELAPVILNRAALPQAVEQIKTGTRNYARRQLIWFRKDQRVHWLPSDQLRNAKELIITQWKDPKSWI